MQEKPMTPGEPKAGQQEKPPAPNVPGGKGVEAKEGGGQSKPPAEAKAPPKDAKAKKKRKRVTPKEAEALRAALLEKLGKAKDGLTSVQLAKQLGISTSKLTYVVAPLLESKEVTKVEVKNRVTYFPKGAKPMTREEEHEKAWKELKAMLQAAPKGLGTVEMAKRLKRTRQFVVVVLKPHVKAGEVVKVGSNYQLAKKPGVVPPKKEAAAPAPKPLPKKEPEKKEVPPAKPKPYVAPAYKPPEKVKTGRGIAWLAFIVSVVAIILWLVSYARTSSTAARMGTVEKKVEQKLGSIDALESALRTEINQKFQAVDRKILNSFFNRQITDLEKTQTALDGLSRMTDDPQTQKRIAETKAAVSSLIDQLKKDHSKRVGQ